MTSLTTSLAVAAVALLWAPLAAADDLTQRPSEQTSPRADDIRELTFVAMSAPLASWAVTKGGVFYGGGGRFEMGYVILAGVGVQVAYAFTAHGGECMADAACAAQLVEQRHMVTGGPSLHFLRYGYTRIDVGGAVAPSEQRETASGVVAGGAIGVRVPMVEHLDFRGEFHTHLFVPEQAVVGSFGLGAGIGTYW